MNRRASNPTQRVTRAAPSPRLPHVRGLGHRLGLPRARHARGSIAIGGVVRTSRRRCRMSSQRRRA
jgi:hypothetical protein